MIPFRKYQFFDEANLVILTYIVVFLIIIVAVNTYYSERYKVVNMPSSPQTRSRIVKDIREHYPDAAVIYDLGSGWGGLCRKLAKHMSHANINGYEISFFPFIYSKIIQYLDFVRSYTIRRGDLFKTDVSNADIVVCYLSPYHMKRFETEMIPQMKAGSLLYSQGFPLNDKKASHIIEAPYSIEKKIYCYFIDKN